MLYHLGCSIKCYPKDYKKITECQHESITAGKFPICNYVNDTYTNWLTQNSINLGGGMYFPTSALKGTVNFVGNAIAGNAVGMATSATDAIVSTASEFYEHSFMSPQVSGNTNQGDVNTSNGNNDFYSYNVCIKEEYARLIDQILTCYGYKVNDVKYPNITGRLNWNFVKTVECNFDGNIPQEDLQNIRAMFNNGVTFWHTPRNMYNYFLPNGIVS